jgi:hypothetical protein
VLEENYCYGGKRRKREVVEVKRKNMMEKKAILFAGRRLSIIVLHISQALPCCPSDKDKVRREQRRR